MGTAAAPVASAAPAAEASTHPVAGALADVEAVDESVEAELPPPPPGLAITADGQFVLLRDVPRAAGPDGYSCDLPPDAESVAGTKVLPEALFGSYEKLAAAGRELGWPEPGARRQGG